MKKERCMLFFDIDGTLITTDGKRTFPESAKRALREARERGHLVYINTGRVMENVDVSFSTILVGMRLRNIYCV